MKIRNAILLGAAALSLAACSRVEPGHVGIKVNNLGSDAGVQPEALGVGYYFAGPGTNIYEYPIYTNTYVWTQSAHEGKPINEEMTFSDKNGLQVTADVAISYHVDQGLAPKLFTTYRADMDAILATQVRPAVRDALNKVAGNMTVEEIYGPKRAELIDAAQARVQAIFATKGLVVERLYLASPIRLPDSIMKQINLRMANEQAALAAQANVATSEAEARARIAKAEGEAKATQIEAEALRTNPAILQQKWIDKWDGQLPTYVAGGNSNMMLNIPNK